MRGSNRSSAQPSKWLSDRSDRAWSELFFLAYSVVWMAATAVVILTGAIHTWSDPGYLLFGILTALPAWLGPLAFPRRPDVLRPWRATYWLKLNVWIFIVVAFGTYFGTHYFFDLMGMEYAFPVRWTFEAAVVGRSDQHVPVFMYPLTHAYFITYHVVMIVVLRRLTRRWTLRGATRWLVIVALAYVVAFAETAVMANDALSDYFRYADKARMLWLGSIGYASYYVVTLPMLARMDDDPVQWPMRRVVFDALGACFVILCLLEVWAQLVGPL